MTNVARDFNGLNERAFIQRFLMWFCRYFEGGDFVGFGRRLVAAGARTGFWLVRLGCIFVAMPLKRWILVM